LCRLIVQNRLKIPDRRIGIKGGTVVKLDALTQFNDPAPAIRFIHPPGSGKPGHQARRRISL
jgi:hypothetical protein